MVTIACLVSARKDLVTKSSSVSYCLIFEFVSNFLTIYFEDEKILNSYILH